MDFSQTAAETLALACLDWLAGQDELWPVFLGSTGASEADLKARVGDPDLLGAVLDFILMDDAWLSACCRAKGLAPDAPVRARMALPGGSVVHWT